MATNKKGGRPKKGLAEKLKYKVSFMLRTEDYYDLKAKAGSAGLRIAEFTRRAVIGSEIKPRLTTEQAEWLRSLAGMGNNLNQLARQAHKNGYDNVKSANITLGKEIYQIVKLFRNDGKDHKG